MPVCVLVVEDNQNISRFLQTTLELEGYRVQLAATLRDGLSLVRSQQPDLVLLDLSLPDGSGWEFLESMQAQPDTHGVPVAILTASADRGMADRGRAAGAVDFLTKPVSARELVAHVRQLLESHSQPPGVSE